MTTCLPTSSGLARCSSLKSIDLGTVSSQRTACCDAQGFCFDADREAGNVVAAMYPRDAMSMRTDDLNDYMQVPVTN